MNKSILVGSMLAVFVIGYYGAPGMVFAQYMGSVGSGGEITANTLEENLELAQRRIDIIAENPASGSGTPYLDASGVLGASVIAGAVFGGIAGAFFFKGRSGRYAAQGRG